MADSQGDFIDVSRRISLASHVMQVLSELSNTTNVSAENDSTLPRDVRFHVAVKIRGLLACDAVYCCGRIPTFQRSMLLPIFGMKWSEYGQHRPPKCRYPTRILHGVTSKKTSPWIHPHTFRMVKLKVKVKLSLCFFLTKHHAMKALSWRWVVRFMPRPLYPQGKSP
jgi:hypothetical protein